MKRALAGFSLSLCLLLTAQSAVTFDGSAGALYVASYTSITDLTTLSISLWAYRVDDGQAGLGRYIQKADGWSIQNRNDSTNFAFSALRFPTDGQWTTALPSANAWHHILVTFDYGSAANDPIIYVDGTSQAITEIATPMGVLTSDAGGELVIGNNASGGAGRTFNGRIADVAIWNSVLTSANATSLSIGASPLSISVANLVSYAQLCNTATPIFEIIASHNYTKDTGTYVASEHPLSGPRCFASIFAPRRIH